MNRYSILLLTMLALYTAKVQAQSDYETWAQQKREQYDKWKKMQAEIVGNLPTNTQMNTISSFIDQGFSDIPTQPPAQPATQPESATQPAQPAQPAQPTQPVKHEINIWVVIIGIADYIDKRMANLNYTDDDAYKMYAFYKSIEGGSLPDKQITLLIDEEAGRANVLKAINDVYLKAGKNDMIIFFFSGHGSKESFILHDFDGTFGSDGKPKGTLSHEELNDIFQKSQAKYKYIITDACHSGGSAQKSLSSKNDGQYYGAFENANGGLVMLLSSMAEETSLESRGIRQGVFSHFMLRGLKGEADKNKDGLVSVVELFEFVKAGVTHYTNNHQNPVLFGDYNDVLPISICINY